MSRSLARLLGSCAVVFLLTGAAPQAFSQEDGARENVASEPKAETAVPVEAFEQKISKEENSAAAEQSLAAGNKFFIESDFENAVNEYLKAVDYLKAAGGEEPSSEIAGEIEKVQKKIADSYYYWAQDLYLRAEKFAETEKYDQAIEKCKQAIDVYPLCKDLMNRQIAKYEKLKERAEYKNSISAKEVTAEIKPKSYQVDILIKQGQIFYSTEQWDKAREKFDEVLSIEPYNSIAINYQRKIYYRISKAGEKRMEITSLERNTETAWKAIAPIIGVQSGEQESLAEAVDKVDHTKNIKKKLEEITIDHIEFDDTPVSTAVKFLKRQSKEKDPDNIGVNFVIRYNKSSAPATAPAGGNEESEAESGNEDYSEEEMAGETSAEEGGAGEETSSAGGEPHVTLSVDNTTLLKAIQFVCEAGKLQYRIEEHAVVIAGKDVVFDDFVTKSFTVEKEALELMGSNIDPDTVKQYFQDHGVDFSHTGAKVVYDEPATLTVTNTPEQIQQVADIIEAMNVIDPQVLIMVKFVEIAMNDLEELGFEYIVSRPTPNSGQDLPYSPLESTGGQYVINEGDSFYIGQLNTNVDNVSSDVKVKSADSITVYSQLIKHGQAYSVDTSTSGNIYYKIPENETADYGSAVTWHANDPLVRNAETDYLAFGQDNAVQDTVFNWSHYNSQGYNVNAKVHALDQADSSDLLASPRVTTRNGQLATIKMVTDVYYPESWTDSTMETVTKDNTDPLMVVTPSIPEFGEVTEEGIVLSVEPTVEDNYMIHLNMEPVILDMVGWTDYSYKIPLSDGENTFMFPNTLKMPIIEARTVKNSVMSYDGETIVLGGIIQDKISEVEDQYPVLGDVPVVGRLFQSKGRSSQKNNLLIFLTSRLVNPDGSFVRESEGRGVASLVE